MAETRHRGFFGRRLAPEVDPDRLQIVDRLYRWVGQLEPVLQKIEPADRSTQPADGNCRAWDRTCRSSPPSADQGTTRPISPRNTIVRASRSNPAVASVSCFIPQSLVPSPGVRTIVGRWLLQSVLNVATTAQLSNPLAAYPRRTSSPSHAIEYSVAVTGRGPSTRAFAAVIGMKRAILSHSPAATARAMMRTPAATKNPAFFPMQVIKPAALLTSASASSTGARKNLLRPGAPRETPQVTSFLSLPCSPGPVPQRPQMSPAPSTTAPSGSSSPAFNFWAPRSSIICRCASKIFVSAGMERSLD